MFLPVIKSAQKEDISIQIQLDNHSESYICDCGDASGYTVKEYQNAHVIFISHTHIDHFVNFDQFLRHQIGSQKRVIICGPKNIHLHIQSKIKGYHWNLIENDAIHYEIREIIDSKTINYYKLSPPIWELIKLKTETHGIIYQNNRFNVRYAILDHKIPSIAYAFKEVDTIKINLTTTYKGGPWISSLKKAYEEHLPESLIMIDSKEYKASDLYHLLEIKKGNTLGIIMDHAAHSENHQKIKDTFSNFDTVYIECFYKTEDREFAKANFHSYAMESGKIMREASVKNAFPIHFSRKYTTEDLDQITKEFYSEFNQ